MAGLAVDVEHLDPLIDDADFVLAHVVGGNRVQPTVRGDCPALVAESGRLRSLKKWTPRLSGRDIIVRKGANELIA